MNGEKKILVGQNHDSMIKCRERNFTFSYHTTKVFRIQDGIHINFIFFKIFPRIKFLE